MTEIVLFLAVCTLVGLAAGLVACWAGGVFHTDEAA